MVNPYNAESCGRGQVLLLSENGKVQIESRYHSQGSQINTAQLGASLDVAAPTAKRYIELLEDLLLIRTLRPWSGNVGKRLVKTPKVYIRDSGLTHALLNLTTIDDLLGHAVVGASWEGFVIENLLSCLPVGVTPWFYRTSAGAGIDLVMEQTGRTNTLLRSSVQWLRHSQKVFIRAMKTLRQRSILLCIQENSDFRLPAELRPYPWLI